MRIQVARPFVTVFASLLYLLIVIFQPTSAGASELIYTVQIGSFEDLKRATRQYHSVISKSNKEKLDSLRIEQIGLHYAIRIGNFVDPISNKDLHRRVKHLFPSSIRMKAYMKDERILKLYSHKHSMNKENTHENSSTNKISDISQSMVSDKDGINIQAKPFNSITSVDSSQSSGSTVNDQSEQYIMLPVSDELSLHGTVIMNNIRLAIIKDSNSKQSGLYNLNDQVGGFTVLDILDNTVILNKNNAMVQISLWESNKLALSNPEPYVLQKKRKSRNRRTKRRRRLN